MRSIFGFLGVNPQQTTEFVQNMFDALASRGGDAQAVHAANSMVIGVRGDAAEVHRAIVMNPMQSIIAAIEGEIYNLPEINRLVGAEGTTVPPAQEFAPIIRLYEKFGKDFPKYLNGIFTIVLWDDAQKTLLLARDQLGSHSLFYTKQNGALFFATTLQALLKTGVVPREISPAAMHTYFSSTAVCPPKTLMKNVFCLRPGAVVTYTPQGNFTDDDYWPIKQAREDRQRSMDDFAEEIRALLLDAIAIRARAGEHYGSLVSGGIDTGIITATLASLNQTPGAKLPVFSIAFEEQFYSDAALQQIMYARYALEPHTASLTAQEFADILPKAVAYLDTPVNDVAMVGMYKAFALAKDTGCTAVFDGEAADEIFYTGHAHAEREFQRYLRIPFGLRRLLLGSTFKTMPLGDSRWQKVLRLLYRLGLPDNERRLIGLPSFYKHATSILLEPDAVQTEDPLAMGKKYLAETAVQDPLNIYYYGLLKTFLPDDLLFKNERMASAHGITNRTPFIDYRLVELGYRIPQHLKIRKPTETDDGTKLVYKKAIQGLIPDEILYRKKTRGFSQPSAVWYRHELKDFAYETLFSQCSCCVTYLNKAYMYKLFTEPLSEPVIFDYLLNSLLIFEFWLRAFLK